MLEHEACLLDEGHHTNGYGRKTVVTDTGKLDLQNPRDRQASFDPKPQ